MENRAHALLAGIFTIGLVVVAVLLGMWLNRDRVERVPYEIATTLPIPGLNPQAAVRYRGLDVGKVSKIEFDSEVKGQILIHISIRKETPITHSTYAFLGYQGVTGLAYIQLEDDGSQSTKVNSNKQQVARIQMHPGLFDKIQARGMAILEQTELLTKRLNTLFEEDRQKRMLGTIDDVGRAARKVEGVFGRAEPAVQKLSASGGSIDKMNDILDSVERETLPRLDALTQETRQTLRSIDRTVEQIGGNPQSILFGPTPAQPGPGEPGFVPPQKGSK